MNWQLFLVNIAIGAFTKLLKDKDFVAHIQQFVLDAFNFDIPGDKKKELVVSNLKALGTTFGKSIAFLVPMAIGVLIDAFVVKAQIQDPKLKKDQPEWTDDETV